MEECPGRQGPLDNDLMFETMEKDQQVSTCWEHEPANSDRRGGGAQEAHLHLHPLLN